jgi:hypothetical protein
MKGFGVLPPRWVVERTFSWFGRNRRLAKDFENLAEILAIFVTLASIQLALRRLVRGSRSATQMTKVGKPDCEETFARASGNDEDAPVTDLYALASNDGPIRGGQLYQLGLG